MAAVEQDGIHEMSRALYENVGRSLDIFLAFAKLAGLRRDGIPPMLRALATAINEHADGIEKTL